MNRSSQFVYSIILGLLLTFSLVSHVSADGVYERLRSFGFPDQLGQNPSSALIQSNGFLYGTASSGGLINGGKGVVYRINEDGSGYTLLHSFSSTTNGNTPQAPLIFGGDGALYGTTSTGSGDQKSGVVFKVSAQGGGYQELHTFGGASLSAGALPRGGLVKGLDGALYGVTLSGGLSNVGVIYKLQESGAGYQVVHHFTGGLGGERPAGELLADGAGWLYGVTEAGGITNRTSYGTIFRINENGSGFTTLFVFDGTNGSQPRTTLRRAPDNKFYGVARGGGVANKGVVFRINADGSDFSVLHHFAGGPTDGSNPVCAPVLGPDGLLYGATSGGGTNSYGVLYRLGLDGNNYEVLTQVPPSSAQNENFISSLLLGSDGKWRGITSGGGGENLGTFYRVNLNGTDLIVLRHFTSKGGDARGAAADLMRASDGYFYGTAPAGGIGNAGAIFRFTEGALNYAVVHSFTTNEGSGPNDLIEAQPGLLFGTAASGGQFNKGTVFRMETNGANFTVLHHFAAGGLGERPLAGLFLANDGRLYGTTTRGSTIGFGTIYRLFPDGTGFEVVYSFFGTGYTPICSLVQGTNSMLYGTADDGGNFGRGVVFRVNLDGSDYTVLHHFAADASEGGGFPVTGLTIGPDQALYGTTAAGPAGGLFKLNQDGSNFTMLRVFIGSDGSRPEAPVHFGLNNVIYGTTQFGGTFGGQGGTVFRMNPDGSGFAVLHSFKFPVGPEGARSTAGVVAGADGWLYGVTPLGGDFSDGVVYRVHPTVTTNYAPMLTSALSDNQIFIHDSVNYSVSSGLFFDRDWGQTLTWTATGVPPGVVFNPTNLTITGIPTVVGNFDIAVTATDNGSPPAISTEVFQLRVVLPDIAIVRSGTNILVHWPADAIRFELQETDKLGPNAVWNSLGLPSGYQIGDRRYAVYPMKPGKWFYRLAEY